MSDCIFCKIANKEIPSSVVYEDDHFLAFLDQGPVNPGHTLLIPKQHSPTFLETPDNVLEELIKVAKKIGNAIVKALDAPGININLNNGEVAGQKVFHVHYHLIPRFQDDGHKHWPHSSYKPGEEQAIQEKIKSLL